MENPTPGSPEYKQIVHGKTVFCITCIVGGFIVCLVAAALITFQIPQSEPAKQLIIFVVICGFGLIIAASLALLILRSTASAQTRLQQMDKWPLTRPSDKNPSS